MPTIGASELLNLSARIFESHGTPRVTARRVADSLVQANLRGHDSHGVMRISRYLEFIRNGQIKPKAKPVIRQRSRGMALVDGCHAFGQIGADAACNLAAEIAQTQGVSSVALHNVMHIGRLGEYAERQALNGFATLILTSNGGPLNSVAPFGGRDRIFGTNPLAFAAPAASKRSPLVIDFASSGTAEGKLAVALACGRNVEAGVLVDNRGRPTRDPKCFYDGGALLPFGTHKGYGIMLMIEILARLMSGYIAHSSSKYFRRPGNATLIVSWSVEKFGPLDHFTREMSKLGKTVSGSRPAQGSTKVMLPGEPENRSLVQLRRKGIFIPAPIWDELRALANEK